MTWFDRLAIGFAMVGFATAHMGVPFGYSMIVAAGGAFIASAWRHNP